MIRPLIALAVFFASAHQMTARADFLYSDFSSVAGLQLNGSAAQVGNVLRLTPAAPSQSGSAFTTVAVPLGSQNSFSTYFQFRITNSGGFTDTDGSLGADGIVFVVQTVNNNAGGAGGGIGYQGISPSLGVEFDTWNNGEISGNHVGIDLNGSVNSVTAVHEPTRFNNGQVWNAWVDYNGSNNLLEVRWSLSNVRPVASMLSRTQDLVALLGQNTAFIGFTSGTGAAWGNHDILTWEYRDEFSPIDSAAVPEPTGLAVLALNFAGVIAYRRLRRKSVA